MHTQILTLPLIPYPNERVRGLYVKYVTFILSDQDKLQTIYTYSLLLSHINLSWFIIE